MDLPYKFGADDTRVSREEGFNLELVTDGEAARLVEEEKEIEKERTKKKNKKKDGKKISKEERERQKAIVVGPRVDESGVPSLPVRKAKKQSAPPPNKKCVIM